LQVDAAREGRDRMANVSELVAATLTAYETSHFFCMMGGDHELWMALHDAGIKLVNCRSESGAVYMADGYARVSGKPGFVYGQRGPGVANVAGALADAYWAHSPVISLTSSIAMTSRDRFEYQELDGLALHTGVTRWNKTVSSPDRATAMLRAAIRIATGSPPGPVHLEIPAEMFRADADGQGAYREPQMGTVTARRLCPDRARVESMVELLAKGERPLIVAGAGVIISEAWSALTAFAEALSIPVATTLGGKGAIDSAHDLAVGVIGRNSSRVGNDSVRDADMIVAIGTRLGGLATHRWTLPFGEKRLIQADVDPGVIGHNYPIELGVIGDAKLALELATTIVDDRKLRRARTAWAKAVATRVADWRVQAARLAHERPNDGIHPASVISALREVMAPDDLIAADTGAHGGWVGALFPVKAGRSMVRANGSLGWVFPGAMGAAIAAPERRTVAVSGDGGMLYHIAEFETALRCNIPIVAVVLNNASLASERHTQQSRYKRVITEVCDYRDVDFAAIARAFGAHGARVNDAGDLNDALRDALAAGMPALVDVRVSRDARSPSANNDRTRLV
jgi:acetolactate synthase I/II/III large subunit